MDNIDVYDNYDFGYVPRVPAISETASHVGTQRAPVDCGTDGQVADASVATVETPASGSTPPDEILCFKYTN